MILKSLDDLDTYKSIMITSSKLASLKDINEISEGGGESTNNYNNKLFYWNFEPYYIQELVKCYEEFAKGELNQYRLEILKSKIAEISNDMINKNTCPIESILYASKTLNYLLDNDLVVDTLGNIIAEIYLKKNMIIRIQ